MTKESLRYLYARIKKPSLTREEAERKVCQEVFLAKLGGDSKLLRRVSFKGGIILDQLSKGRRGYTKDIDFDLVKYPLSDEGLKSFFLRLSPLPPYENITINVASIDELRHKNYEGKRVALSFSDGKDVFSLTVDIGVHLPLFKGNRSLDYEIAFGGITRLSINPVERMIAEKLATFSIYGTDNTRDKDLFDAYWLITHIEHDRAMVAKMLEALLVRRTHFFKTLDLAIKEAIDALRDTEYAEALNKTRRNWTGDGVSKAIEFVVAYLERLSNGHRF